MSAVPRCKLFSNFILLLVQITSCKESMNEMGNISYDTSTQTNTLAVVTLKTEKTTNVSKSSATASLESGNSVLFTDEIIDFASTSRTSDASPDIFMNDVPNNYKEVDDTTTLGFLNATRTNRINRLNLTSSTKFNSVTYPLAEHSTGDPYPNENVTTPLLPEEDVSVNREGDDHYSRGKGTSFTVLHEADSDSGNSTILYSTATTIYETSNMPMDSNTSTSLSVSQQSSRSNISFATTAYTVTYSTNTSFTKTMESNTTIGSTSLPLSPQSSTGNISFATAAYRSTIAYSTDTNFKQQNDSKTRTTQSSKVPFQDNIYSSDATSNVTFGSTIAIPTKYSNPKMEEKTTVYKEVVGQTTSFSYMPSFVYENSRAYVEDIHLKAYNITIPIIIFIGLVVNTVCIAVLLKPRLRSVIVNKYFLLLAISDLMVCVLYIPIAVTRNGCSIHTYSSAFYYGHFAWSTIEIFQAMCFYTLLFLSYDRFIAVWFYQYFKSRNAQKVLCYRIGITFIINILMHLVLFINVDIWCSDNLPIDQCQPGGFIIEDSYRMNDHKLWHGIYFLLHELLVRWLPGLLLVIFNAGLVVAIAMGRLNNPTSSHRNKRMKEFRLTITLIAITCSFIVCTFPTTIYTVWLAANIDKKCYGLHEAFRAVSNCLQLVEHVVHIGFLSLLNPTFRTELLNLLSCKPSTDTASDTNQSSRDLQMYQIHRRSGHSPFPGKSPGHSPYNNRKLFDQPTDNKPTQNSLAPPTQF